MFTAFLLIPALTCSGSLWCLRNSYCLRHCLYFFQSTPFVQDLSRVCWNFAYEQLILPQEKPYQLLIYLPIGLIPHGEIQPCLLIHDALVMGEGIKPTLPVIRTHAALAKAAKAKLTVSQQFSLFLLLPSSIPPVIYCRKAPTPLHPLKQEQDTTDLPLCPHNGSASECLPCEFLLFLVLFLI